MAAEPESVGRDDFNLRPRWLECVADAPLAECC